MSSVTLTNAMSDAARIDAALPAFGDLTDAQIAGILGVAEELVREQRAARTAARDAATVALVAVADAVSVPAWEHTSAKGNHGFRTPWTTLPDGRKIMVHVLDAKVK